MAKVILSTGENYTVAAGNTAELFGTTGVENVTIQPGASVTLDASFNQGGDTLVLSGNAGNYTMQVAGTTVTLVDTINGNTIEIPAGTAGADIEFADGTRQLVVDTDAGAVKLGNDTITSDPTTPSDTSTGGNDITYSIAADASSVTEGEAVTFTVTATSAADTDTTLNFQISGVNVAGGTADPATDLGKVTGEVTILAGETTGTFTLTPADDGVTEGFEGFNVALLDSQFQTVATSGNVTIKDGADGGKVFTLTTGLDNAAGGDGDDSVFGVLDGTNDTFNSFDTINLAGGNDTFNLTMSDDYDGGATITGVENFELKATANKSFDFNGIEGVQSITADRGTNLLTATNIASTATTVGMSNTTNAESDLTAQFTDSTLAGDDDTVTVNLAGGVGSSASAAGDNQILVTNTSSTNGAENLTVNVTDAAAYIGKLESKKISGNSTVLEKVTVTGDQDLTILTTLDFNGTTATLDASAATGDVNVALDTAVTTMTVTGGAGDDTFNMGIGLNATDVIDGGEGTDTVMVSASTVTLADQSLTSVEVFQQEAADGFALTLDADGQTGLEKVVLVENDTTGFNMTVNNLASGVAVELVSDADASNENIGNVWLNLKDASGTDDVLDVTLKGSSGHAAASNTIDMLTVANVETVALTSSHYGSTALTATDTNTITSLAADTTLTSVTAAGDDALSVTMSGAETNLATFDASAMTDVVTVNVNALTSNIAITTGSEDDSIVMGGTLNNNDTIDGGANSSDTSNEDTLTATVTGLTATTGALNISNVERLNLTNGGTAVIDASNITGAAELAFDTTTKTTVTGLEAGTAIGIGFKDTDSAAGEAGEYDIALADATGDADSLDINLNDTATANTSNVTLKAADIETVNINFNDTDASLANASLTVTALNAATVNVAGSKLDTGHTLGLGTLDTDTKTVDASGYSGILTATAGAATATSFTVKGGVAHDLTGSTADDTFTVNAGTANAAYTVDGNGGTDALTVGVVSGALDLDAVTDVDTVTLDIASSAAVTMSADANVSDGLNEAATVNITGGNSLSALTIGTDGLGADGDLVAGTLTTFDASGFNGKLTNVNFSSNDLDATMTVIGTANADKVSTVYGDDTTIKSMTAVETFDILAAAGDSTVAIDLKNVDDVTKVILDDNNSAQVITLTDLDAGVALEVETGATASGVVVDLIDSSSDTDELDIDIKLTDTDTHTYTIDSGAGNDIETLNLTMTDTSVVDLDGFTMSTASKTSTVNVSGAGSVTFSALDSDITTIDASAMTGAMIMDVAGSSSVKTITGGAGDDTIYMSNKDDVLDGGAGADTLKVSFTSVIGGLSVDLNATGDQIATFNGAANAAVQTGFQHVDLSGYTGNGAEITAHKDGSTITGTASVDSITLGAGADVVQVAIAAGGTFASDTIVGLSSTDKIDLSFASGGLVTEDSTSLISGVVGTSDLAAANYLVVDDNTLASATGYAASTNAIFELESATFDAMTEVSVDQFLSVYGDGGSDAVATVASSKLLFVAYDNSGNAGLFYFQDAGTPDTNMDAGEVQLLGTFSGVGADAIVAANFV